MDIEGFAQGFEVAVERAAEALEDGVVDVFELKMDGMGHVLVSMMIKGRLKGAGCFSDDLSVLFALRLFAKLAAQDFADVYTRVHNFALSISPVGLFRMSVPQS